MALKAGLVGVNPKGVDKNGMPIGSAGNAVDEAQLTANGKQFHFAYDETSEKYGYKLDGAGDFIPFESAGGGPGWVAPASLSAEGLSTTRCTILSGGYFVDDTYVYVDIILQRTATSTASVGGLPAASSTATLLCAKDISAAQYEEYEASGTGSIATSATAATVSVGSGTADGVYHVWGQYLKAQS